MPEWQPFYLGGADGEAKRCLNESIRISCWEPQSGRAKSHTCICIGAKWALNRCFHSSSGLKSCLLGPHVVLLFISAIFHERSSTPHIHPLKSCCDASCVLAPPWHPWCRVTSQRPLSVVFSCFLFTTVWSDCVLAALWQCLGKHTPVDTKR